MAGVYIIPGADAVDHSACGSDALYHSCAQLATVGMSGTAGSHGSAAATPPCFRYIERLYSAEQSVSHNVEGRNATRLVIMLATGQISKDQWVAYGIGLLQVSHLWGNGMGAMPYHAVVETAHGIMRTTRG